MMECLSSKSRGAGFIPKGTMRCEAVRRSNGFQWIDFAGPDKQAFGVINRDDSMYPQYFSGDVLIVSPNRQPQSGNLVIARTNENTMVFRRFTKQDDSSRIALEAINPQCPPVIFIGPERNNLEILGVVVEVRRPTA